MNLHLRGVDRNGATVVGRRDNIRPAALAEELFRKRWQWAEITNDSGEEVGGVGPRSGADWRSWWGLA